LKAFPWKRWSLLLGATALSLMLFSCGSGGAPEPVVDLSMSFGDNLPVGVQSIFLVVHHKDGSPDRWFDLKTLAGPRQDLRGVPKFGYFTVLTEVRVGDGSLRRHAATFPVTTFLGFDKALRIGEDGSVAVVAQGTRPAWAAVTVRGSCPGNATMIRNQSFGVRGGGVLECNDGAITEGEVSALTQTNGLISTILWTYSDDAPTNPPQYAPIIDAGGGATITLAATDFKSSTLVWRLEVVDSPAGYSLLTRVAAIRSGAEIIGYNPFYLVCGSTSGSCAQAYAAAVDADSYTIYGQLRRNYANLVAVTTSWKPVSSPADVGQWDYASNFDPAYENLEWTGSPPVLTLSGGVAVRAQRAVAVSYHTATSPKQTRSWLFYPAETGSEITFPELPGDFAGFVPDPAADGAEAWVSGYDFNPLDELTTPPSGRTIAIYRSFRAVSSGVLAMPDHFKDLEPFAW